MSSSATNQERVIFGFRRLLMVPFRPWYRQQLLPLDSVYYTLCSPHLRADYTTQILSIRAKYCSMFKLSLSTISGCYILQVFHNTCGNKTLNHSEYRHPFMYFKLYEYMNRSLTFQNVDEIILPCNNSSMAEESFQNKRKEDSLFFPLSFQNPPPMLKLVAREK